MPALKSLYRSGTATLDATGAGETRFSAQGTDWILTRVAITTSGAATPRIDAYRDDPSPVNRLGGTYSGKATQATDRTLIESGQTLVIAWTGGDPGAIGYVRVEGIEYPQGEGVAAL